MSIVISIIVALLVLTILVVLHEGGHFFMGKWLGFKINEFSVGMGPKLWSKEKNGTVYSIRAFPIGGMCAFEGEDEEAEAKADSEKEIKTASDTEGRFNTMPAWKRFLVAFAGPFMNIVTAIVFAVILLAIFGQNKSVISEYPIISEVSENSPAQQYGLSSGDFITAINGKKITSPDEMISAIRADEDGNISVTYLRVDDNSQYLINGIEVDADVDMQKFDEEHHSSFYNLKVQNANEQTVDIQNCFDKESGYNKIGAAITNQPIFYEAKYNVLTAVPAAFDYVIDVIKQLWNFLGTLFSGGAKIQDMSGIVGVVDVVNDGVSTVVEEESFSTGTKISIIIEFILYLAVLLGVNLGFMNLLPLPALDGGRIVFNIIEMIAGKAIPAKVEGWIHTVGLFLLLGLIVVITAKDIFFLFK